MLRAGRRLSSAPMFTNDRWSGIKIAPFAVAVASLLVAAIVVVANLETADSPALAGNIAVGLARAETGHDAGRADRSTISRPTCGPTRTRSRPLRPPRPRSTGPTCRSSRWTSWEARATRSRSRAGGAPLRARPGRPHDDLLPGRVLRGPPDVRLPRDGQLRGRREHARTLQRPNCSRIRGTYTWRTAGRSLQLEVVDDPCAYEGERGIDLATDAWTRIPICRREVQHLWPGILGCGGE